MVISRTPFRISLAGGGSDLPDYYRHTTGRVVTMAIDRHMYVTVNRRFDSTIRVSYTQTEIVTSLDDLRHDLIREALRLTGVTSGIEVTTIADLPAGIGLGSSSALTVGVLHALYAYKGEWHSQADLAAQACRIEIDILGKPIGKQDQYVAAHGGLQDLRFHGDERVVADPVVCPPGTRERLLASLMLFFTGLQRDAGSVLSEARRKLSEAAEARERVHRLVAAAESLRTALARGDAAAVGPLLDSTWRLKKQMASNVSSGRIDDLYARALEAGATGGKICGAGGGGCLLLYVEPAAQDAVRQTMTQAGLREVPFGFEPEGSRIVHYAM